MNNSSVAPFVKWAGGKRQLLPQIKERMPEQYNNYFEPFVGGGAVLFGLLPAKALINDINKALINVYEWIKKAPEEFLQEVNKLDAEMWEDGKKYYYSLREHYNDKLMKAEYDVELAALFVFLNKHCFNGLYRVNGKGLFNVPSDFEVDGLKKFVFVNREGKLKTPGTIVRTFHGIRNMYNKEEEISAVEDMREPVLIPDFSPHTLRHTYCTRMAENGMDVKVLQEIMGHANISVTMQVYNHATFERTQKEVENMVSVLGA